MRYFKLLLLSLLVPLLIVGVARANEASNASSDSTSSSTTTTPSTTLEDRVKSHEDAIKVKLTAADEARMKLRCKAAQGVVSSVTGRVKGIETSRNQVYGNVVDQLTTLSAKLKAKNVDTTELNNEITTLKTKVTTYKTDLTTYKQAITDLSAINCTSDPTAFKATLEAARTSLLKVGTDIKDIRTYITGTIKPTLTKIHDQLEMQEKTQTQQ